LKSSDTSYIKVIVNALSNYGGYAVIVAVGFFMQPFVVRRLGSDQYSIIPLVMSCLQYLQLLKLGIGMGMSRYISAAYARGDEDQITRISTSIFFLLSGLGIILLIIGGILSRHFSDIFTITPGLEKAAMIIMLVVVVGSAVQMPFSILESAFVATQKYTWQNIINSGTTLLQAAMTVILLKWGGNWVVWVIASQVAAMMIRIGCEVVLARHILPSMRIRPSFFAGSAITSVWSFSLFTLLGQLGGLLYWHTDQIIINKCLTAHDLTIYSVATSMAIYIYQLTQVPISVLFPVVAELEATGHLNRVPNLVYRGTRLCVLVAMPGCIVVALFAEPFFQVYLGPQYSGAGKFVPIVMLTIFLGSVSCMVRQVPTAIGKPVFISILELGCAVLNLVLTLIFVLKFNWGLAGVAWATAIATGLKNGVILPWYLTRIIDLSIARLYQRILQGMIPSTITGGLLIVAINLFGVSGLLASCLAVVFLTVPYILLAYTIGLDDVDREMVATFWTRAKLAISPSGK